ncbi:hypothetical protein [Pseudomonas savastanoi]|uniref:hypothetical protein n=1 Tax=Pseudomonas savastanoi TaxID=29438 RepID=UPI00177DE67E|nr:hypothetical protein [Pseudomonas savastanoi]QOI04575.1 hypothetical protein D5S10_12235 [Pseudomonas savastanoi]
MKIDWSKAPIGTTGAMVADFNGATVKRGEIEWIPSSITPKGQYQVGAGAWVYHEAPNPWNGEGPPPVGMACEYQVGGGTWFECDIRYVTNPGPLETIEVVMYAPHLKGEQVGEFGSGPGQVNFRPIRTAEQIAADERLHKIRNALAAIKASRHFPSDEARQNVMAATVEAMIDAGFVQQVPQ